MTTSFCSKVSGLKILLFGVCVLLVCNILFNYVANKDETTPFELRYVGKVRNESRIHNHSKLQTKKTLFFFKNSTVIKQKNNNFSQINNKNDDAEQEEQQQQQQQQQEQEKTVLDEISMAKAFAQEQQEQNNSKIYSSLAFAGHITLERNWTTEETRNLSALSACKFPEYETAMPVQPNITLEHLDVVERELSAFVRPGGYFEPKDCVAQHHVAIVVPFRDRYAHLSVFLRNIHPFLMQQNISYRIFIIEQTNGQPFNRAALMNIGYLEALKFCKWDCFIFHDVDLLPLDKRNLYNCPRQPRHMSVAIDTLNYKLPYNQIFGGVSAMTRQHFQLVNGFSNSFSGWGGEDDDMFNRIKHAKLFISRYPINIARYKMLKHQKERANPKRFETLANGIAKIEKDGINSIKYEIYSFQEFPIFTWYLAELKTIEQNKT